MVNNKFLTKLQILKSLYDIKVLKKRIPLYCEWEITSHCNMQCRFCSTLIDNRNATKDILTEEALSIIEQLTAMGTKMVHFTGGEPTLRDDLPDLISRAQERGMLTFITTNGSAPLDKLEKILHADLIRVSIDGTEKLHDYIRNKPGAFKDAIKALQFFVSRGIKPQMTIFYTKDTSYEMFNELCQTASRFNIQLAINVLGRNINDNCAESVNDLSDPIFKDYINVLDKLKKDFGRVVANPEPIPTVIKCGGLDVYGCRVMDILISVKHDGGVSLPCNGLTISNQKGRLRDIYYGQEALKIRGLQGKHPACKGCYIKCMCSASALLKLNGLLAVIDSYIKSVF